MGQHRYFRMARIPDADQSGFPLPRFNPCSTNRARSRAVPGPGATRGHEGHSRVVELLLQVANDGARALSRARPVHSVHETEEHAALDDGRRPDHPPRAGILRLDTWQFSPHDKLSCMASNI